MDLRKRMMGLEELHMYDLYTPIINEVDFKIDYEKAFEEVLESLKILGDDYYNNIQKAKVEGWIDVYESQGKIGGAYSWGCFETHPYVLLNHNDNLNSAFTLAHELGHAMHSFYSNSSNPYHYSHYKIFVAEVASTLNEALFMDYLQNKTEDINTRMYLINYFLEQFRTTVYRQTMFAEFEMTIHKLAKEGEILTYDLLSNTYYALNKKYYGENVIVDKSIEIEWARIPHFYTSFYVYKYATGFTSAMAILNLIKKDKDEAIVKYHEFLSSGGSDYPIEILKNAGVDMSNTKPIELAMGIFKELLDQMEDLVEKR
jgi:oligoendopeptidase F